MTPTRVGWRRSVLDHFPPRLAADVPLTTVHDPDELLGDELVVRALKESGYQVFVLEDPVQLRYELEVGYAAEDGSLSAVVRYGGAGTRIHEPPYDILATARRHGRDLRVSLASLFPHLDPDIVRTLDAGSWDRLHEAYYAQEPAKALSAADTADYVLQRVFSVAPDTAESDADLLRILLERHYAGRALPKQLDRRLIERLRNKEEWADWPLEEIVPTAGAFFSFLQERWPAFVLGELNAGAEIGERSLVFSGPDALPFDDPAVRVYIDNLFREGFLQPIPVEGSPGKADSWIAVGVDGEGDAAGPERMQKLISRLKEDLPAADAGYADWIQCAFRWAEIAVGLGRLAEEGDSKQLRPSLEELRQELDLKFLDWLQRAYGSLSTLSYVNGPVLVHHIPHYLRTVRATEGVERLALIVVDGLALDQWLVLRDALSLPREGLEERAALAWIPTLTSVSRQALLSGLVPHGFADSIMTTQKETNRWSHHWQEAGVPNSKVSLIKQGQNEPLDSVLSRVSDDVVSGRVILGVVINDLDELLHKAGSREDLYAIVKGSLANGIDAIVSELRSDGFRVHITSDHGNVEASGVGKPNVGSMPGERALRAHVYPTEALRAQFADQYAGAVVWPPTGLPPDYLPLLAPGRGAFIKEGGRIVTHGGITLEEVVVPFVTLEPV